MAWTETWYPTPKAVPVGDGFTTEPMRCLEQGEKPVPLRYCSPKNRPIYARSMPFNLGAPLRVSPIAGGCRIC